MMYPRQGLQQPQMITQPKKAGGEGKEKRCVDTQQSFRQIVAVSTFSVGLMPPPPHPSKGKTAKYQAGL